MDLSSGDLEPLEDWGERLLLLLVDEDEWLGLDPGLIVNGTIESSDN